MDVGLALFLGLLQGATELFPVSSLGHAVVIPKILHLGFDEGSDSFLAYLVLLHIGTALVLLWIYREDWKRIAVGFVRAAARGEIRNPDERLAMHLALATVPTGAVAVVLQKPLQKLFASPLPACCFLMVNALILLGAEQLRRRDERRRLAAAGAAEPAGAPDTRVAREAEEALYQGIDGLSLRTAMLVGFAQVLALLPGISRSGVTLAAGLVGGLRHEEALRFAFLLATPIILGAGIVSIPDLAAQGTGSLLNEVAGAALAAAAAYASARFLIRYFRVGRLEPYAAYCGVLGVVGLALAR